MSNIYTIKTLEDRRPVLSVNPETAGSLRIENRKVLTISFGELRQFTNVTLNEEIPAGEVRISRKIADGLYLPLYPDYEMILRDNELIIGPYIGLLMSREDHKLTKERLERMTVYAGDYDTIHGALVIFSLNKTDPSSRLIEGYCYNPETGAYQKAILPFPSAIYRTVGLSDRWKNIFNSVLEDRYFNNHYFSKWDLYNWISTNETLTSQVPFTVIYRSAKDVFSMLERFNKIYIKPISGLGGHGIMQAYQNEEGYVFEKREYQANRREVLKSVDEASEFIQYSCSAGRYLVQQAVELIRYREGVIDFRCIMQKDQAKNWVKKAIIGRCGRRGSIVSNISSGGWAFRLYEMEGKPFPLPDYPLDRLEEDIAEFAGMVCGALDRCGLNCGTLGLDIGVDVNGKLWLIEVNNRDPDPSIALNVGDRQLFDELRKGPLYYAKALAGFPAEDSD